MGGNKNKIEILYTLFFNQHTVNWVKAQYA